MGVKLGVSRLGETSLEGVSDHSTVENTQRDMRMEKQDDRENCTRSIIIFTILFQKMVFKSSRTKWAKHAAFTGHTTVARNFYPDTTEDTKKRRRRIT